jgi:membrane protease YdiL (CAAX protease family)
MKCKELRLFFILTFLLSWLAWLPGVLITNHFIKANEFVLQLDNILKWLGGAVPSLVAFFLIYKEQRFKGLKTLISRVFKLKLGYWYIPIFLILPIGLILAHFINTLFGHPFPNPPILGEPWMILPLFILFLIMVASEEFGWRGFALEKMQTKWNALTSSIILGSLWSLWHIPMFLSKGFPHHDKPLPFGQLFLTFLFVSILITWLQNNTRSLAPAFILHALVNLSGEVLPLIDMNKETQGNYSQWIITNLILAVIVIFVLSRWGIKTLTRN